VHRKIANLGEKTFRWERAAETHEVKFNYTLNSAASQLLQIFEGLARQQELLSLLERRMRYDRLGINDALLQFETDLNRIGRMLLHSRCNSSGVESTRPRHTIFSASSMTQIDVSFRDTSRPTYWLLLDIVSLHRALQAPGD